MPVSKHFMLGRENCPNCNADAALVGSPVGKSDALAVSVSCSKCKHSTVTGFTTVRAVKFRKRKDYLIAALEETTDDDIADEILAKIGEIERQERRMQLGL